MKVGSKEDFFSDVGLGKIDAVRKTLAADPSWALRADGAGRTPMHYAAANAELEIAKLLLETGAPVVDDDRSREFVPLHYAIASGDAAIVELLLKAGTSPNTSLGHGGETPDWEPSLHMAIKTNRPEVVKALIAYKVNLEGRNTYSQTALHYAALRGNAEIASLLIRAGADVNSPQGRFETGCGSGEEETPAKNRPLHFAAARGNSETIKALYNGGADLEAKNRYGRTPIMAVVAPPLYTGVEPNSQIKNIEALLAAGANINARDDDGKTILDLAENEVKKPYYATATKELIDFLLKHGAKSGAETKSK